MPQPTRAPDDRRIRVPYLGLRRWLFFGLVSMTTLVGLGMMLDIVRAHGITLLEVLILGLFGLTFGWIAIAFWSAVIGFGLLACRRDPLSLAPLSAVRDGTTALSSQTALVMPVHNEDPERVMCGVSAMLRSLEATGQAERFHLHLLSDTTDPEIARREADAWTRLTRSVRDAGRLFYRRRPSNVGRKAGNIEEFCRRAGARYDFMVVLDADSLMRGATIVELARIMEANPEAGLLQTLPVPAGRASLFGRLVQFAAALYSPMLATGQSFWQADAGNYWGHNAIVRAAALDVYCSLPVLRGRPPLGGPMLSHDFVEAALLRRAGWCVYLLPQLDGSHEEVPGNVPDFAARDRRWAQGSLQHLRLLGVRGLHPLSRVHFLLGAMGYLSSLLWLLMLLAGTAYVVGPLVAPDWVADGPFELLTDRVMPWNMAASLGRLVPLLGVTVTLLFLPKAFGLGLALVRRRDAFGGAGRLLLGGCLELLFSVVVAPIMMVYHSRFVLSVLAGRDVRWEAQARAGRAVSWREAWQQTAGITAAGVVWSSITLLYSPMFFVWLTPIFAGLLLATPLVRWTGSEALGVAARRRGLFVVPTETAPPPEVQWSSEATSPGESSPPAASRSSLVGFRTT